MNFVQPIRDPEILEDIKELLKTTHRRNYMMVLTGLNTGLRISDILKLRIRDVTGTHIVIREKKTGKHKRVLITPELKRELKDYVQDKPLSEYLIKSREGTNRPITPSMAYKIMREIAADFGLQEIGCHTLRKTFGYFFYRQYKDVAMLMRLFNHSSEKVTLRYIGIEQDTMDTHLKGFRI
ncbi:MULTISPECIES: site-specific integrase [unclassified Paenibacillus]|uniref:site-specific integrase n=1 Tax=unclassified Paenibacillus TaxID=185978 RepID=UPI0009544D42|nr:MULTISPECIES: site-specific integrase [unclassified Paenibacillus]ASS66388.1 site-specific integrase [Paenibacillus sp. RUD330]SIQ05959.1 Phage integrase family protein [Paenibacillus sp. RU4X]SIQ26095.1 Phage integrase family protein [Paenibacillus sp. RU4T]